MLTHRHRVGPVSSEHVVQLFDMPDSLGVGVAAFLAQGLAQGGEALVVARPRHVDMIKGALVAAGYDPDAPIAQRRFIVLDARTTLGKFMRRGAPDAVLFETVVGDLVRRLANGSDGHLHVYGEMVDLLAEEGSYAEVEALEGLWNELASTESFSLLCGYASSHFAAAKGGARLRAVCHHHTRVHQNNEDLLANWLLTSVADGSPS